MRSLLARQPRPKAAKTPNRAEISYRCALHHERTAVLAGGISPDRAQTLVLSGSNTPIDTNTKLQLRINF